MDCATEGSTVPRRLARQKVDHYPATPDRPAITFQPSKAYEGQGDFLDVDVAGVPRDQFSYLTIRRIPGRRLQLIAFAIPIADQGKGYGRRAIETLEAWARESCFNSMHLESVEDAVGFWRKLGFHESSRPASEEDWVPMSKVLCNA